MAKYVLRGLIKATFYAQYGPRQALNFHGLIRIASGGRALSIKIADAHTSRLPVSIETLPPIHV